MYGSVSVTATRKVPERSKKSCRLLNDFGLSSDEEDRSEQPASAPSGSSSTPAWERAFDQYINGDNDVPDGMSLVEWWGVRDMNSYIYIDQH